MKGIAQAATLAVFIGVASLHGAAQGSAAVQSPAPQRAEPARQTKARDQQPGVSAQATPNCSGRPDARCTKKKGAKKLRTIF